MSTASARVDADVAADSSRDRILDATEQLVAERGYTAASISLIAKASGLPGSSIYWHFGSKEGLLAAMVARGSDRWLASLAPWSSYDGDFAAFLRGTALAMSDHARFIRVLFLIMLDGRPELAGARESLRGLREDAVRRLRRVIASHFGLRDTPDDRALATRLARYALATLDGIYLGGEIDPDDTPIEDLADDLASALDTLAATEYTRRRGNAAI